MAETEAVGVVMAEGVAIGNDSLKAGVGVGAVFVVGCAGGRRVQAESNRAAEIKTNRRRMEEIVHDRINFMEEVYPKHIYEPIRRQIAVDYVRHELRKYLPSLRDKEAWKVIDGDVETWFDSAPFLFPVRDFWNGVEGIMMGFKLYNQLLAYITAEDVNWNKEEIEISKLTLGTENKVEEAKKFFELTASRKDDPIIVVQKQIAGEDKMVIYDGNGRASMAKSEERKTILAYVGRFTDESRQPNNYWLATSVLMEIGHFAKMAWQNKDEELYQNYLRILKDMLKWSESGKYEMKNRVISGPEEFKKRILSDLEL